MANITRFRPDPLHSLIVGALLSSFISGGAVAVLATQPPIAVPAVSQPCQDAPDVIGCLIAEAEEEADEPPQ